jgi:hypothetical protein
MSVVLRYLKLCKKEKMKVEKLTQPIVNNTIAVRKFIAISFGSYIRDYMVVASKKILHSNITFNVKLTKVTCTNSLFALKLFTIRNLRVFFMDECKDTNTYENYADHAGFAVIKNSCI